jgi:hypothetical protein
MGKAAVIINTAVAQAASAALIGPLPLDLPTFRRCGVVRQVTLKFLLLRGQNITNSEVLAFQQTEHTYRKALLAKNERYLNPGTEIV